MCLSGKCSSCQHETKKELFDVLKALRGGKKVTFPEVGRHFNQKVKYYTLENIYGDYRLISNCKKFTLSADSLLKYTDWEEYVEPLEDGYYWTYYTEKSKNTFLVCKRGEGWWSGSLQYIVSPPYKILNKVEGPIE